MKFAFDTIANVMLSCQLSHTKKRRGEKAGGESADFAEDRCEGSTAGVSATERARASLGF